MQAYTERPRQGCHGGWTWLIHASPSFPGAMRTNHSLEKPSRVISCSARGISPACTSSVLSSSPSTRTCSHPHGAARGGKTPHFALSLPDPSPVRTTGWFCRRAKPTSQQREEGEVLPSCFPARGRGGEGKRGCLQYVCPFQAFISNTCFFFYAKHVSSVFCLLDFILKGNIFMAWRDKDMRKGGKVVQKVIKCGGWLS